MTIGVPLAVIVSAAGLILALPMLVFLELVGTVESRPTATVWQWE